MTHDTIRACFKPLYDRDILSCFISVYHLFPLYEHGKRVGTSYEKQGTKGVTNPLMKRFTEILQPGREIRLLLQLTGVSQLQGTGPQAAPYSFRIQHQILGAYMVD